VNRLPQGVVLNLPQRRLALGGLKPGDRQRKCREPNPDEIIRTAADCDGIFKQSIKLGIGHAATPAAL
jgi:hypothetical protein